MAKKLTHLLRIENGHPHGRSGLLGSGIFQSLKPPLRVPAWENSGLIVDDNERRYLSTALGTQRELEIVDEAADGVSAVQKAEELQPHLILLDLVLPGLNGIDAARKIRELSPNSKILFVSMERNPEVVRKAMDTGARGYLVKSDAGIKLFLAIKTVLEDKQFVSSSVNL